MHDVLRPVELMLLCLAGVLTERERLIRLYQREEIRILHEQLGKRKVVYNHKYEVLGRDPHTG